MREAHIGKIVDKPDHAFMIDIPTVHLRNHLYDSLNDYSESCPDPILYIPDMRILTPDSVRQIVSFLRTYAFVGVIACARKEDDVPYLFKFLLSPIFYDIHQTNIPIVSIARELIKDNEYVELVSELTDLGFFENPRTLYIRGMSP